MPGLSVWTTLVRCIIWVVLVHDTDSPPYSLSAGLFRQATYSTVRLGVYQSLFDRFSRYFYSALYDHYALDMSFSIALVGTLLGC